MKTQQQNLFNNGGEQAKQQDAIHTKETVSNQQKTFGTVDMWNILRQRKSTTIR